LACGLVGLERENATEAKRTLVLQCQFGLGCGQMGSSPECLNYLRPEPFFAPLAVPTVDRTIGPKLLFR
jgi:hypothetical protein